MIEIGHSYKRGYSFPFKSFKFSGGEIQVQVGSPPIPFDKITIKAHLTSSDEIFALLLATDALRRDLQARGCWNVPIHLQCPYLPYARQDRVMENGESLGIKVICDLINSLNFATVEVWDVHSDVALALLNNVHNYGPESFVQMIPVVKADTVLVAPDAGAIKKVFKVAKGLGFEMVRADKQRSTKDGSITGTTVYSDHIGINDFLIVDDICDGGRTFTELAKQLRPLTSGKILLYVTHGIFSKGLDVFDGLIDHIYTAKPFPGVGEHALLTVLPWESNQ